MFEEDVNTKVPLVQVLLMNLLAVSSFIGGCQHFRVINCLSFNFYPEGVPSIFVPPNFGTLLQYCHNPEHNNMKCNWCGHASVMSDLLL